MIGTSKINDEVEIKRVDVFLLGVTNRIFEPCVIQESYTVVIKVKVVRDEDTTGQYRVSCSENS